MYMYVIHVHVLCTHCTRQCSTYMYVHNVHVHERSRASALQERESKVTESKRNSAKSTQTNTTTHKSRRLRKQGVNVGKVFYV